MKIFCSIAGFFVFFGGDGVFAQIESTFDVVCAGSEEVELEDYNFRFVIGQSAAVSSEFGLYSFSSGINQTFYDYCHTDYNSDNIMSSSDLTMFLSNFGFQANYSFFNPFSSIYILDINDDNLVSSADLTLFLVSYGSSCLD